ncbi:MAG: cyclic nucleotide-binding domain-containing protein [Proteobacteria bacterium]|nr:cyclic nucleotide-binding domain-containing protein [Pseudomonadota bacterium]MBU1716691.1 cyclic nucleotide-binding domain-containing protein [Pseudomonadota bacterium]
MLEFLNHPDLKNFTTEFAPGENVFLEGDQSNDIYILVSGQLDVLKGDKKISELTEPGSLVGEVSFLLESARTASVVARTPVKAISIPNSKVAILWKEFPDFAVKLTRILARRLQETTEIAHGFREFCDRMPDAVIMTDSNLKIISWNQSAEKLYGRTWDQMRHKSIDEIYDNQAVFQKFVAELKANGKMHEQTLKINHPTDNWRFVSTSTTDLHDSHNHTQGFLFVGRDVTGHHQLEKKHRKVKNWLTPLVCLLIFLALINLWRQPEKTIQPAPLKVEQNLFNTKLSRDYAALQMALALPLTNRNLTSIKTISTNYFDQQSPEQYGITGLLLLNEEKNIIFHYSPTTGNGPKITGKSYDGVQFKPEDTETKDRPSLFMVSRGTQNDKGVEAAFPISYQSTRQGWIVFQLDMKTIDKEFNLDLNSLSTLPLL